MTEPRKVQSKRSEIDDEIRKAVMEQLEEPIHYRGKQTYFFESEFANYVGTKYAVSVNSGTSAMLAGMAAMGVGRGDEVIIPANAYISSVEVPVFLGATPVFCDVDPDIANATLETVQAKVTPRTKVIAVTHMYGHPVDMDPILDLARERDIGVLEVSPHALGAEYKGKKAGQLGDVAIFSFGGKNIFVGSTGGMLTTNDETLFDQAAAVAIHGWVRKPIDSSYFDSVKFAESSTDGRFPLEDPVVRPGLNLQMGEIMARIGRITLGRVERWNTRRNEIAKLYTDLIGDAGIPVKVPVVKEWAKHAFLHYVIQVKERDALVSWLEDNNIEPKVHYPIPLPEEQYYRENYPTDPDEYPTARRLANEIITLPMHPWLEEEDVRAVVDAMVGFFNQ